MKKSNNIWFAGLLILCAVTILLSRLTPGHRGSMPPAGREAVIRTEGRSSGAGEKTLEEICLEHNCNMPECGMRLTAHLKPGEKVTCPVCGTFVAPAPDRKVLFYRNPMNPRITSPTPMKDEMGMDYVPVYQETQSGVSISPEKQKLLNITVAAVNKEKLVKTVRASGKIAYDPDLVIAQKEFIEALKVRDTAKDSPLKDVVERAQSVAAAARAKLRLMGMSDKEIDGLEKDRTVQTNLYLPQKGEDVWAYIQVYEYQIGMIKTGMPVDIQAVAYPGETFPGEIVS
ncbi:MAG: efflux RND transporter periplasmic adaptor subunit, partial [Candidatus Omnitrophica bacterium]|nr:efflux RND transporter periplasmic adaptor subunit [Candidatus Omnitrophota bacterium]